MKLKESAGKAKPIIDTNGPPADSMTLTCSSCNRQFRARMAKSAIKVLIHEPIQEIIMVFLISERRTTNVY